jgi:hypothetical protein
MTRIPDMEEQAAQRRREAKAQRMAREQLRADVQNLLNSPGARKVLAQFLLAMRIDDSPFSNNGLEQAHGVGLQDAARWWLNMVRDHCPEKEPQIRQAMRELTKPVTLPQDDEQESEHEH